MGLNNFALQNPSQLELSRCSWWCVALAALLHVGATPAQLVRRPLPLQAMEARVVACIAIVRTDISCWRETAGRKPGGRRKLCCAASLNSLATIQFFGPRPSFDPLHWPFIVAGIAIKWACTSGADRFWCWRCWSWRAGCGASHAVMLTAPSFFVERPKPLAFAVIRFRRGGHWSGSGHDGRKCRDRFRAELRQKIEQEW